MEGRVSSRCGEARLARCRVPTLRSLCFGPARPLVGVAVHQPSAPPSPLPPVRTALGLRSALSGGVERSRSVLLTLTSET